MARRKLAVRLEDFLRFGQRVAHERSARAVGRDLQESLPVLPALGDLLLLEQDGADEEERFGVVGCALEDAAMFCQCAVRIANQIE